MTRKQFNLVFSAVFISISLLAIIFSNNSSKNSESFGKETYTTIDDEDVYDEEVLGQEDISINPPIDTQTPQEYQDPEISNSETGYKVIKVVDGDTLDVEIDGKVERLRLIGIDTPETVDPRKEVQCFGFEASNAARELLTGKFVTLEFDETQGDRDKYRRLLVYVFLPDGTNFNLLMISEGYAYEYTYADPYKYQFDFKEAQRIAQENSKGLWNPTTCSGVR